LTETRPQSLVLPFEDRSPRLEAGVWVAPGAVVVGDVTLGRDVNVWYGCVLRGDVNAIRVGARSNIQDGAVLHVTRDRFDTEVGEEVTIGHRAVVHGCRVGDGALIGIGAIVLDGAVIGEGALVGAGAVVTPGKVIPPRSLVVGTPARVVRTLDEEESQRQRDRALHYVELAHSHAASQSASRAETES
jgi:carbonic anhydrase/acetyltransferase-like protein (isoleucine patch superfamily)